MADDDVTVVIPHIPTRGAELQRALASVTAQTHQPRSVVIAADTRRDGSAATRNRALCCVTTPWVAFLDDDDEFMPRHLETLVAAALLTEADVIYTGCLPVGPDGREIARRPEWGRFEHEFDAKLLREVSYLPVTCLARTDLAIIAQFGPPAAHPTSNYDDWGLYLRMLDAGGIFLHVPKVTWIWHHHGMNTSGRSDRW